MTRSQHQWLHSSVGYSVAPVSRGHGFKTPLKSWLFQASIHNCLNCVHNRDDHSLLDFKIRSSALSCYWHALQLHCLDLQKWLFQKNVLQHFEVMRQKAASSHACPPSQSICYGRIPCGIPQGWQMQCWDGYGKISSKMQSLWTECKELGWIKYLWWEDRNKHVLLTLKINHHD